MRADREAAAKYLGEWEGEPNEGAISTLVSMWAATDSMGASEWVRKLEPGASQDMASSQLAISVVTSDPENATRWALAISNPIQHEATLRSVLKTWATNNPQQARTAIQQLGLRDRLKII